jgi:hypothetical protein
MVIDDSNIPGSSYFNHALPEGSIQPLCGEQFDDPLPNVLEGVLSYWKAIQVN